MNNEIIFYSTPDGNKKVEVVFQDQNFWLTQKALAGLFDVKVPAVSKHLKNIFESEELVADSVISILETTASDGKTYKTKYYNLGPDGKIMKSDISVAKNYLSEAHIKELNRIVSAYLDLAENRTERQILMKMEDWVRFLHSFLELSNYPILQDKGKVSAFEAKLKAEHEFESYRKRQDREYISDFDREIKRIQGAMEDGDE